VTATGTAGATSPRTFVEKAIAARAGRAEVAAGEIVGARVDLVVSDELSFPQVIEELAELGCERVWDPQRVVVVADHVTPAPDIVSANGMVATRRFCNEQGIPHLFDAGRAGIMHVVLPEHGLVAPGDLVVGYDSHVITAGGIGALAMGIGATDTAVALAFGETWLRVPESVRVVLHGEPGRWAGPKDVMLELARRLGQAGCLYQSVEFDGAYVDALPLDGRFTLANMAIEVGAKCAAVRPDAATLAYAQERAVRPFQAVWADEGAAYAAVHELDVAGLPPLVSLPDAPDRGVPVAEAAGARVHQVFIGTCTNGRLSDLRVAAEVLRGRHVHPGTRLIVVPGSPEVLKAALREGLIADLVEAGAVVGPAGCGPCAGLHLGVLADDEVALATSSRNFPGRMGARSSKVYLSGPAVAAATAVAGVIASPEDVGA
jgi:3-isopropylmalate/(R)-2-methylmalate dehydratase large subunit